jgi:hypothetical protein
MFFFGHLNEFGSNNLKILEFGDLLTDGIV